MEVEDFKEFARRRHDLVEGLKAKYWAEEKKGLAVVEALAIAEGLRRQAMLVKPGWPSAEDRAEDLRLHQELAWKLALVRLRSDR